MLIAERALPPVPYWMHVMRGLCRCNTALFAVYASLKCWNFWSSAMTLIHTGDAAVFTGMKRTTPSAHAAIEATRVAV